MIGIVNVHKADHFFLYRIYKEKYKLCRKSAGYAQIGNQKKIMLKCSQMKEIQKRTGGKRNDQSGNGGCDCGASIM